MSDDEGTTTTTTTPGPKRMRLQRASASSDSEDDTIAAATVLTHEQPQNPEEAEPEGSEDEEGEGEDDDDEGEDDDDEEGARPHRANTMIDEEAEDSEDDKGEEDGEEDEDDERGHELVEDEEEDEDEDEGGQQRQRQFFDNSDNEDTSALPVALTAAEAKKTHTPAPATARSKGKGANEKEAELRKNTEASSELPDWLVANLLNVCTALGGYEENEEGHRTYVKGDECIDCIGDLLRAIRKDNEETNGVIHQLTRWCIIQRDLIPILQSYRGDQALCCAALRLMVYITKPISPRSEDPEGHLQLRHEIKLALLGHTIMPLLVKMLLEAVLVPAIEREGATLEILLNVLQLFRNLAIIPDIWNQAPCSTENHPTRLQDIMIIRFEEESVFELLLTLASSIEDEAKCQVPVDHLVLEILYLSFYQTTPDAVNQAPSSTSIISEIHAAKEQLQRMADEEHKVLKDKALASKAVPWSRHHRFGGSFWRKMLDGDHLAVKMNRSTMLQTSLDVKKKIWKLGGPTKKSGSVEVMFAESDARLGMRACVVLKRIANEFLETGYHPLLLHIYKRVKNNDRIVDKDVTHFFWLEAFFLRYFLLTRPNVGLEEITTDSEHPFGHIGVSMELETIRFMLNKMKLEYMAANPKDWTMLLLCLTTLREKLKIIDIMQRSVHAPSREFSTHLQNNLYYDNVIIDVAHGLWKNYKHQGLRFVGTLVEVTHWLIRLVEGFSKSEAQVVVSKKVRKRKSKTTYTEQGVELEEAGSEERARTGDSAEAQFVTQEKQFQFDVFLERFYDDDIISSYCDLMARHTTLTPSVKAAVVKFVHRIFVGLKQQAMFYKLANLDRIRAALDTPTSDAEYKEMHRLIVYILRQFFKLMEKNPILHLEVLFFKTKKDSRHVQFGDADEDDTTPVLSAGPNKKRHKKDKTSSSNVEADDRTDPDGTLDDDRLL